MTRMWKVIFWIAGVLLLFFLIQSPKYKWTTVWNTLPLPLAGKTVVIDPGHGGYDGGARAKDGTMEKEIALYVAQHTRDYLEQAGAIVYLTRETDTDLVGENVKGRKKAADIRNRLTFIHDMGADFFITIHLNALPSSRWSGAQTFYYPSFPENKQLATTIQEEIIRNLENTNRAPLKMDHLYLLKHAEVPGALVEIGFLSNEAELQLLKDKTYQRKMAASIYLGIVRYASEEIEDE